MPACFFTGNLAQRREHAYREAWAHKLRAEFYAWQQHRSLWREEAEALSGILFHGTKRSLFTVEQHRRLCTPLVLLTELPRALLEGAIERAHEEDDLTLERVVELAEQAGHEQ